MPLDSFVEKPVTIMDKMEMHRDLECPVWDEFTDIVANMTNAALMRLVFGPVRVL